MGSLIAYDELAFWSGNVAAVCSFAVVIPQMWYNHKRRSMVGFSGIAILVRLVGAIFFIGTGFILSLPFSLMLSGILSVVSCYIFIFQFVIYEKRKYYCLSCVFPIPIILLCTFWKNGIRYMRWVDPALQIACHVPYVITIFNVRTTHGISFVGQHLTVASAVLGFIMCSISCECGLVGWMRYQLWMLQSVTVFSIAILYGEFRILDDVSPVRLAPPEADPVDD